MPISDWLDLMPATVTHQSVIARNEYGAPTTYSAATSYRARVFQKARRVINRVNGQDEISSVQVWIAGLPSLALDGKIILPDGSTPRIMSWDVPTDEVGEHHMKVYLG